MEDIKIGSIGPGYMYKYWRRYNKDDDEVTEWKPQHEKEKKEIEELIKYNSLELEKINTELELRKKHAKLHKRY